MEKLDLVRKWSINTYKVMFPVLDLFLCPVSVLILIRFYQTARQCVCASKPPFLCSVPGRSCQRSWAEAPRPWT